MIPSFVQPSAPPGESADLCSLTEHLQRLKAVFDVEFSVIDAKSGELVHKAPTIPPGDWIYRAQVCVEVAQRQTAEVIEEIDPLLILAVPLVAAEGARHVAVAGFMTDTNCSDERRNAIARSLLAGGDELDHWIAQQTAWRHEKILALASLFVERDVAVERSRRLEGHVDGLSENLSHTYEEISLLHRIAGSLRISEGNHELAELALDWLQEIIPADAMVAYFEEELEADTDGAPANAASQRRMLVQGACPIRQEELRDLLDDLGVGANGNAVVLNRNITMNRPWRFPSVRELIVVPLRASGKIFAHLAAFNQSEGGDFGTVEASLMNSVATMLGIHKGNIRLYHEQISLLSGMIQSLVSAIDAKDPYTCGHSDRVARIAVRLAQELDYNEESFNNIYLAGLLHDIGKIGIDDQVLRKPGRLTPEEYVHIKAHPGLGFKILKDIKQIKDVLPGVLHHHESWDGGGYPNGLSGDEIPLMARILAVADAFDAMSSDRSYRKGMPLERIETILREGAGQQWDAHIVEAFFSAQDDIREIAHRERERLNVDLLHCN